MFKSSKNPVISMLQYLLETSSLRHADLALNKRWFLCLRDSSLN